MSDRPHTERLHCSTCGQTRPTYIGEWQNTGREAICCSVCSRFIRWWSGQV